MTRKEITANFALTIEKERLRLGYTQFQMAKALEMSLSSYKNMINGVSVNVSIYVVYLAYILTGKLFFELCVDDPNMEPFTDFRGLPQHTQEAIRTMVSVECQMTKYAQSHLANNPPNHDENDLINVYIPTGNMEDGMIFDSINIETVNIHRYRRLFGDLLDCGIKITSNHLHPAYHLNDILLICRKPPRDGDTGIFINKENSRLYIRKFRHSSPCKLEPIISYGRTITIDEHNPKEMEKWIFFGYIITKMR